MLLNWGENENARFVCLFHQHKNVIRTLYFGCNIHVNWKKRYFGTIGQAKRRAQCWFLNDLLVSLVCSGKSIAICKIQGISRIWYIITSLQQLLLLLLKKSGECPSVLL